MNPEMFQQTWRRTYRLLRDRADKSFLEADFAKTDEKLWKKYHVRRDELYAFVYALDCTGRMAYENNQLKRHVLTMHSHMESRGIEVPIKSVMIN